MVPRRAAADDDGEAVAVAGDILTGVVEVEAERVDWLVPLLIFYPALFIQLLLVLVALLVFTLHLPQQMVQIL